MGAPSGDGDVSDALATISTGCVRCTATTKAAGVACARTGICGDVTVTTSALAGSGADIAVLDATSTACASCGVGRVRSGCEFGRTGTCTGAIITTTICMAATNGGGAGSGALACTCIVSALCTATTKDTGAACVRTGICGDATITTDALGGSGAEIDESAAIGIACASCGAGLDPGG